MILKRVWAPDEDAMLRDLAPQMSSMRIAARLQRQKSAVESRARELGIEMFRLKRGDVGSGRARPGQKSPAG
jgi:hypothetical protein